MIRAGRGKVPVEFGDGVLTCRGTFQKFFEQDGLKTYVETQRQTQAIPAEIGVFYAFKDETRRQQLLASRFRRREGLPRRRVADTRYQVNRELLDALMDAVASLGRLPEPDEFGRSEEVAGRFGSLKRAFVVVRHITGDEREQSPVVIPRMTTSIRVSLESRRKRRRPAGSVRRQGQRRVGEAVALSSTDRLWCRRYNPLRTPGREADRCLC